MLGDRVEQGARRECLSCGVVEHRLDRRNRCGRDFCDVASLRAEAGHAAPGVDQIERALEHAGACSFEVCGRIVVELAVRVLWKS